MPIQTFIEGSYYLNIGDEISVKAFDILVEACSKPRIRIIFAGAQGYGKDYMSRILLAYALYRASCFSDIRREFLTSETTMFFFAQSLTISLARKVVFDQLGTLIKQSKYFQERFMPNPHVESELRFPDGVQVIPVASHHRAVFGLNVLGGIMDEMNFLPVVAKSSRAQSATETWDQAVKNHNAVMRRLQTRFAGRMRSDDFPGLLILVSSRNYPNDFIDREIALAREAAETTGDESTFVVDLPSWGTAKADRYPTETFTVEVGDEGRPSRILGPDESPQPGVRTLRVPDSVDLRDAFKRDIEAALRDLGGVSTMALKPLFRRRDLVSASMDSTLRHPLSHFITDFETVPLEIFAERFDLKDRHPRFCHLDLSESEDATGLCVLHVSGWKAVTLQSVDGGDDNTKITEVWPIVTVDLLLKIIAPPNGQIDYENIRRLLYTLRDDVGLPIKYVTADSYQSYDGLMQLRKRRFVTGQVSVESRRPYVWFRNAVYQGRFRSPQYDDLLRELVQLEDLIKEDRVNHPPQGSKDLADSVCGAHFNLLLRRETWVEAGQVPALLREAVKKTKETPP